MKKDAKEKNGVIDRYVLKMDELNILSQKTIKSGVNKFNDILIDAYIEGFAAAAYMIGEDIDIDPDKLETAIKKKYEEISISEKADDYIKNNDVESLRRLLESEFHRVYNQAILDYAEQIGNVIYKTWVAIIDDKTRDTHFYLDGTSVPTDAYFYSFDGDKGLMPGGFERAENNANCRCIIALTNENI